MELSEPKSGLFFVRKEDLEESENGDGYYWRLRVKRYDPSQPRVPAGSPEGGRWTGEGEGDVPKPDRERKPYLRGAPHGSAYDFVADAKRTGGKIPRGSILTPADGSPPFRVERSNGFVISGWAVDNWREQVRIDLRNTDAGLDLSGSF